MKLNQTSLKMFVPRRDHLAAQPKVLSHQDCVDILKEVDNGDFEVSDWEAEFIESNIKNNHFTLKQKKVINKLDQKYLRKCHGDRSK